MPKETDVLMCMSEHLCWNATAALQFAAWWQGDGGGDGRRRAGLQTVTGADELRQSLKRVYTQLHKLTLKGQRTERSAGCLESVTKNDLFDIEMDKCIK